MEYGVHVAPHDVIKMCNFSNKIFRGFWSTGVKISVFLLTLLVIVTTVRTAQPVLIATGYYSVLVSIATFVCFWSF